VGGRYGDAGMNARANNHLLIERTEDIHLIRSVIGLPEIRYLVLEDDDGEVPVPLHPDIYYLSVKETVFADGAVEDKLLGIVAFMPVNAITWNPHIAILPMRQNSGLGTQAMLEAQSWMFSNTPCRKLVAHPPVFKGSMIRVFEKCGFRIEGMSRASFSWNGSVYDRLLMGREA
jgi:RimJ/RimL family protein N-acetyltransferase